MLFLSTIQAKQEKNIRINKGHSLFYDGRRPDDFI
jgi:hypothetical protein